MNAAIFCLLPLLLVTLMTVEACKITVKFRSMTKQHFRIQLYVPTMEMKTEQIEFTGPATAEQKVDVSGPNCAAKKWVVRVWKRDGAGEWVGVKQDEARIDGNGWAVLVVDDMMRPLLMDRFGVWCGESTHMCGWAG